MNIAARNALQYIRNTNGGATLAIFMEDHDPVGARLWADLLREGLAEVCEDRVMLTAKGAAILDEPGKVQ